MIPKSVRDICHQCAVDNMSNRKDAIDAALPLVKSLPEYPDLIDDLVYRAVATLVGEARHKNNDALCESLKINRDNTAKVVPTKSKILRELLWSDFAIGGKSLSTITGAELPDIVKSERAKARGHSFRADLAASFIGEVDNDEPIGATFSEDELRSYAYEAGLKNRVDAEAVLAES